MEKFLFLLFFSEPMPAERELVRVRADFRGAAGAWK